MGVRIFKRNLKGQIHTIEVVISLSILAFILIILISSSPSQEFSRANYKLRVFTALKSIDDSNLLRDAALIGDSSFIENQLKNFLPGNIKFNVSILNKTSNITSIPINEGETVIVSYIIAGKIGNYSAREVRAYIWGFS